jgi:hypothetical protein
MKINTQKLLLFLYLSKKAQELKIGYTELTLLFPEISSGGVRSLIHYLKKNNLLFVRKEGKEAFFSLSPLGDLKVQKLFPFVIPRSNKENSRTTVLLFFHTPPSHDPSFMTLRKEIKKSGFIPLQRSLYFYQGALPEKILSLCQEKYFSSVLLLQNPTWVIENAFVFLKDKTDKESFENILSGISKEIDGLILKKHEDSLSTYQAKLSMFSVFERIFFVIKNFTMLLSQEAELADELRQTVEVFITLL